MRGLKPQALADKAEELLSHALRVRGLKRHALCRTLSALSSHALRVRGLKHFTERTYAALNDVARSTRAWIETALVASTSIGTSSHALRVRGLKLV